MDTDSDATQYIARITTGIHRLSAVMGRLSEGIVQDCCGLGMSQFRVLWVLYSHEEGVQQSAIAKWLNLTEAAISRQLQLLKDGGLLTIKVDDDDRRSRTVSLTASGRKFTEKGLGHLVEATAPIFSSLDLKQQKQLLQTLDTLFYGVVEKLKS